jgi:hypothetical protein
VCWNSSVYLVFLTRNESSWNFLYRDSLSQRALAFDSESILMLSSLPRFGPVFFPYCSWLILYIFYRSLMAILLWVKLSLKMKLSKHFNEIRGSDYSMANLGNRTEKRAWGFFGRHDMLFMSNKNRKINYSKRIIPYNFELLPELSCQFKQIKSLRKFNEQFNIYNFDTLLEFVCVIVA